MTAGVRIKSHADKNHEKRYAAFLSYSHKDEAWAAWLHRSLERYRVPQRLRSAAAGSPMPERLGRVFRDRDELPSAGSLSDKIEQALARSNALVVICSPSSAQSRWVNQEILTFKRLHGEEAVFCLIADGEPCSGGVDECFAPALRWRLDESGKLTNQPAEPIAADARPGKDGRALAQMKLIAGLLGVGLDDLRQRDQQRRQRRLLGVTAASLGGMALTAFLAIHALMARNDAERRQEQAEDLIEFMLGDLKDELGKVGRLDALDATARKALDYFTELPEKDLDNQALARRAQAFRAIGQIHVDRLEWDQALASNRLALETHRALHQRNPRSTDLLFDLSQSEFWVGYTLLESGSPVAARVHFESYLELSERLLQAAPDNPDWAMEVSYGNTNLAGIHDALGEREQAVRRAREGVAWNREAVRLAPAEDYYREQLAGALAWLANALLKNGQLQDAADIRMEANELLGGMHAAEPENMQHRQQLAASFRGEANARILLGEEAQAEDLMEQSLTHFEALVAHDPSNDLWAWWAQDAALDRVLMAVNVAERMPQADPVALRLDWLVQLGMRDFGEDIFRESRRLLALAVLMHLDAPLQGCIGCTDIGLATKRLWRDPAWERADSRVAQNLALTHLLLASLGVARDSSDDALSGSIRAMRNAADADSNRMTQALLARLLMAKGQHGEARPLIRTLLAAGYRHPALMAECRHAALCERE